MSRKSQEDGDKDGTTPSSRGLLPPPSSPLLYALRPAPECVLKHVDRLPPGGVLSDQQLDEVIAVTSPPVPQFAPIVFVYYDRR